uniref:Putative 2-oxoglutarate dehydrogenase E1 component DHKTD1 n=1 Tax=Rhipicephalus appendiculatus TaxID=34631 RepID=A0A131YWL7_RHIAP
MNRFARLDVASRRWHVLRLQRMNCSGGFSKDLVDAATKEDQRLSTLVDAYRQHGHKIAKINPISSTPSTQYVKDLELQTHRLTPTETVCGQKVESITENMRAAYCGPLGLEFMHMDEEKRTWFADRYESLVSQGRPPVERRKKMAEILLKSQVFDNFLAAKFSTVKRYGGEGAESMMAFFYELFCQAPKTGVTDIVVGMPHRGRLNLLTGLFDFPPVQVFQKMKGMPEVPAGIKGSGDVLSHLSTSVDLQGYPGPLHATLLPNPSHLEGVSPVAVGKARARMQSLDPVKYSQSKIAWGGKFPALAVQIHGDASFAAQGVIMETVTMSRLPAFTVGGSIHLVVNNQIGFTTPASYGRSSPYVSDIMKMIDAPVIHVNGDDPEAVALATQLAMEFREKFNDDILLDMLCFRRWGHNEMDDPTFTNPLMYDLIHARDSVPNDYAKQLENEGSLDAAERQKIVDEHMAFLSEQFKLIESYTPPFSRFQGRWSGISQAPSAITYWDTGVDSNLLKYVGAKSVHVPRGVTVHPHLVKHHVNDRLHKIQQGRGIEWATAEALALGSLLYQGFNVRICGQDVGRGTFSQRHAILVDRNTEQHVVPLNHLGLPPEWGRQGYFEVVNSPLSEEAVLSFEYGFSLETPKTLVIWEAQFGDFHNSAQVVIDTFVTSGEAKWFLQSGMVVLLPHGFDGAGPEHSSCRIERFLQMTDSKEDAVDGDDINFGFVNPTTPAQYFHLLRRQMVRNFRKPLVMASPKILLRHPEATSTLEDMAPGKTFVPVLSDPEPRLNASRVLLCSGKHYYALAKQRTELGRDQDTAIIRLEALCPFPAKELVDELAKYTQAKEFIWCQEEHRNMGAWFFVQPRFQNLLGRQLKYAGRANLGVPAVGVGQIHQKECQEILQRAFAS